MALRNSVRLGLLALALVSLAATGSRHYAFGQMEPEPEPEPNGLTCQGGATFNCSRACGGGAVPYNWCINMDITSDDCVQGDQVFCDDNCPVAWGC